MAFFFLLLFFLLTQTQLQSNLQRVLQSNVRRHALRRGRGQRKHRLRQAIFPLISFEKVRGREKKKERKKEKEKTFQLCGDRLSLCRTVRR